MATSLRHQFVRADGSTLSGTEVESDRSLSRNGQYLLKNSPWVEQLPLAQNGVQPCLNINPQRYSPSIHALHTKHHSSKCFICSNPETSIFSQPLKRCITRRRRYHLECDRSIVQKRGQSAQARRQCSRCCTKTPRSSSIDNSTDHSVLSTSVSSTPSSKPDIKRYPASASFSENISDKHVMAPQDHRPPWMIELKYGSIINPCCDRCREQKRDCIKSTTWCQVCKDAHRNCTWDNAPLDERVKGYHFTHTLGKADSSEICHSKFSEATVPSPLDSDYVRPVKRQKMHDIQLIPLDRSEKSIVPPPATNVHSECLPIRGITPVRPPSKSFDVKMESSPSITDTNRDQKSQTTTVKGDTPVRTELNDLLRMVAYGRASMSEEAELNTRLYNVDEAQQADVEDLAKNRGYLYSPASVNVLPVLEAGKQEFQEPDSLTAFDLQGRELSPPYSPPLDIGSPLSKASIHVSMQEDLGRKDQDGTPYLSNTNLHTATYGQKNNVEPEVVALNNYSDRSQLIECSKCRKKMVGKISQLNSLLCRSCKKIVQAATKPESPKTPNSSTNPSTRGKEASLSTVMSHDDYRNTLEKQRRSLAAARKDIARLKRENKNLTQRLGIVSHHKSVFPPGSFHGHFFDVAPDLRPFDREAKMAEISKRPTRKDTWGSDLSNVRPMRGTYLHREVNQDIDINCQQDEPCYTEDEIENDDEDCFEFEASTFSKRAVLRPSQLQWAKITGVPANPIPVLASDKTLAYREGIRDSRGRLPRAKVIHKVGRDVAGQLK